MFEPFTQLASLDKLTPWNRSTFYKISTSPLKPALKRPALQNIATMSRRFSHSVPVPYYKLNHVNNVRETIERGERRTKFPNPAVSSHQLLLNATTNSTKQCNSSHLLNVYRPIPYRRHFQASYAGPPSCANLAQRFSTNPTPVLYYQATKDGEAIKRKEYVYLHDAGGLNPKDYDVLLKDVDYNVLQDEISTLGGIPYLQEATKSDAVKKVKEATAIVFGPMHRMIFPAVVHNADKDKAHWVYFIIATGSPITYLSTQVNTPIYGNSM